MIRVEPKSERELAAATKALDKRTVSRAMSSALRVQVQAFKGHVEQAFATAGGSNGRPWQPNANGGTPFDGSSVQQAVRVNLPPGALRGYVYIPRNFRFRGGKDTAFRALVAHEEGRVISIRVTAKMLAYLAATRKAGTQGRTGQKLKVGSVLVVRLPRRSFLVDTIVAHGGDKARRQFIRDMHEALGPGWSIR